MKCEKCESYHDGSFGSGRFCSRKCACSKTHSKETKQKISNGVKLAHIEGRVSPRECFSEERWNEILEKRKESCNQKLLNENFSDLSYDRLRKRILLEQNNCCNRCKMDTWLNEPIPLEVEHKNGDHSDNRRENVEALCPNCHSLTSTWRGRNKKTVPKKVTDEQVVKAFLETGNIRQALLQLGLAAKGGNYGRVKRALTQWGIPY